MTKANKNKQEKFKNDFEELKKFLNRLIDMIIFQTEIMSEVDFKNDKVLSELHFIDENKQAYRVYKFKYIDL